MWDPAVVVNISLYGDQALYDEWEFTSYPSSIRKRSFVIPIPKEISFEINLYTLTPSGVVSIQLEGQRS